MTVCRQGLILFALVLLAAGHASWLLGRMIEQHVLSGEYIGGFRLLGDPLRSVNHFFVHIDFGVMLIALGWLANIRQKWPLTASLSPAGSLLRHRLALTAVLFIAGFLLLWNLGVPILWQDEAQSALISRTVVETGLPRGTDGLNYFSQEQGAEYADGFLWRWHTWLPFYMVAACFQLFGESEWSARLPGVILGWLTIPLIYRVAWEMWKDRRTALFSATLLSIHLGMILLSRQCRYYSALSLFTVVSVWGYWRLLHDGKWGRTLLVAGMVALFHTHYVYTGICGLAFLTHGFCFRRDKIRAIVICALWVIALCAPWVAWFSQMKYGDRYGRRTFHPERTFNEFFFLTRHLSVDIFPWTVWLVPWIASRTLEKSKESQTVESAHLSPTLLLAWLTAAHVICLAPIIPQAYYRYLTPVIPLAMLVGGRALAMGYQCHPALAGWGLATFVLSSPMMDFVHEQTAPVLSPVRSVVDYLKTHADPKDVVLVSYGDLPMKFYLPNRIVGTLTGEELPHDADWVIMRTVNCGTPPRQVRTLQAILAEGEFDCVSLDVPDQPFEHREDPENRVFRTDWRLPGVKVYHRRKAGLPMASSSRINSPATR